MIFTGPFVLSPPAIVEADVFSALAGATFAEKRASLSAYLKTCPQAECPVNHVFGDGVYIRQAFNPAGVLLVGHRHKFPHVCLITKGKLTVFTEAGYKTLKKGEGFMGMPGDQRIVYAWEDSVFSTIHMTDERDIETLESTLIEVEP